MVNRHRIGFGCFWTLHIFRPPSPIQYKSPYFAHIYIIYIYNLYLYNIHILTRYHNYGCYFFLYKMAEVKPLHKTFYVMVLWGYSLAIHISISGWWFGTCFIFPYIGNNHPNWLIFFRGVETTNQIWSNGISRGLVGYNMIQLYIYISNLMGETTNQAMSMFICCYLLGTSGLTWGFSPSARSALAQLAPWKRLGSNGEPVFWS